MKTGVIKRFVALLLVLCSVAGLLPAVAVFEAKAADSVATETANLISRLTTSYNNLTIPKNQEVYNYTTLDGVFFLGLGVDRIFDFSRGVVSHYDRLTANTSEPKAATNYSHLWSVPITQTNGTSINTINGSTIKTLDFAVELKPYTGTITYNTSSSFTDDNNKTKYGWVNYVTYEYNRSNSWCGTSTYYGKYLGIHGVPSSSDPKYSIKSLHPNRASAPYLACDNGDGELRLSSSAFPFFFKVNDTNASVKIYKVAPNGTNFYTYWLGVDQITSNSNNYCFTAHTMSQIVREDRNKSTNDKYANCKAKKFNFAGYNVYQVSPVALELYNVLLKAKSYVTGGNTKGAPAETYLGFLKFVESAMATYNSKRTVWNTSKTNADRITCDNIAKDLRSYMALVDIEAKPNSYMDIPLEVLDFRADGLMFEHCGGTNPYTLNSGIPTFSSNVTVPGTPATGDNGVAYRAGLTEPELVNGQIVYRKETVQYIAEALFTQQLTLSDPNASLTKDSFDPYWNSVFMKLVDPNGVNGTKRPSSSPVNQYTLGACGYDHDANYDATIAKTHNGSNGGILRFEQVENCYDLAYYILTNIWRETAKDDYVDSDRKLPYNLKINELSSLRMLKDAAGYYVYSSDKENGRCLDSGVIFNYNLTNSAGSNLPTLNAAAELGFESPSIFGNDSTGIKESNSAIYGKRNYHVMYHMRSSFIYYEDKNLEFTFTGDDDVYFFINSELVCDIGGMHSACTRSIKLNGQIATDLGLKDGDICTFDMFLAERHTTEINLNLRTNIEMMPVGAATDKVQYEYKQAGIIGNDIKEGGVVADKTEVGYGFKLLNRSEHGATDVTFTDPDLKVSLTGDPLALNLGGCANAEDLIFIYRTYDPQTNKIYAGEPVTRTYDSFFTELGNAVADMSTIVPMTEGAYLLTGLTVEQIAKLLKLGLPASVQISVYGFHRTVSSSVGGYTNVVYTSCKPISYLEAGNYVYGETINGFASRNLNVQTMNTVTAEPLQIVIDYGKPVNFTLEEILQSVTYDPKDVKISLKGICKQGKHGAIVFREPTERFFDQDNSPMTTDNGVYDRYLNSFRFTPKGMLENIERVYAMIQVDDIYLGSVWYLTVAIEIIPATIMYYEAEDLSKVGELDFAEKWIEEVVTESGEPEDETTEPGETEDETTEPGETEPEENEATEPEETEPEEDVPTETLPEDDGIRTNTSITYVSDTESREHPVGTYDPTYDQNVLFFDFENSANDRERYSENPIYGNTQFDEAGNWWVPGYGRINGIEDGVFSYYTKNASNTWGYVATGKASTSAPTDAASAAFPLKYIPAADDWCEVRLNIDGATSKDGINGDLGFRIEYFPFAGNAGLDARSTKWFPASKVSEGFFVLKFPLNTGDNGSEASYKFTDVTMARRLNFLIINVTAGQEFTTYIDYIYLGPEEHCPSNQKTDYLYFGFDNRASDQYRYNSPYYGDAYNFDKAPDGSGDDWSYDGNRVAGLTVSGGAMEVTCRDAGSTSSNSPWILTGTTNMTQGLNYPTSRAETAWVRLKCSNMTTDIDSQYELEEAVARLTFAINNDTTIEGSSCYIDFPLSEEQLNGSEYMTLCGDIGQILADHGAERITGVQLSIINAAGMPGKTGVFYVDEIYVGPRVSQDGGAYIAPTTTDIPSAPEKDSTAPIYDSDVLYFGFGNTAADTTRYSTNPVYKGNNFDTSAKWQGTSGRTVSVSNGALHLSGSSGSNSYVTFNTGANTSDYDHLSYTPHSDDWFEIRIKINDLSALANRNVISFDIEMRKNSTQMYKINYGVSFAAEGGVQANRYYTISFKLPANSGNWANTIPYGSVGTVKRFAFNPVGLNTNKNYSCSIDYIYVGPENKRPSQQTEERIYFDFDNDRAAQNKYGSTIYGGDNFDTTEKWRYNYDRTSAANITGGTMTYTLLKLGHPWFETSRNGGSANNGYGYYMHYYPAEAEIVRFRVKFNNVEMMGDAKGSTVTVFFGTVEGAVKEAEPVNISTTKFIPSSEISTDGKWFTYTVELGDLLKNTPRVTGMRLSFADIYSSTNSGTISFDYIYVGPDLDEETEAYHSSESMNAGPDMDEETEGATPNRDIAYGYDSTYTLDSRYSDNVSLYAEGRGVPVINSNGKVNYEDAEAYTELSFSFMGTGFDLISRTGQQQATIRVSVYSADEWLEDNREKTVTVNNKGTLELNQIPVVSVQGLQYGKHHVKIWVNDKVTADSLPQIPGLNLSGLTRGNEFYLDAIRIYDPMGVDGQALNEDQSVARAVYEADKEAYSYIKEIRNILLTSVQFDTLNGTIPGGVFIDANSSFVDPETGNITETVHPDYITAEVKTYNKEGPKNEVYLAPGQAVAFRLAVDTKAPIGSLDIGAKTVSSRGNGTLAVGFVTETNTVEGKTSRCIRSGTAQYHAVDTSEIRYLTSDSTKTVYLVIYNESTGNREENVLSITDIKVAYEAHPDSEFDPPEDSLEDKEIYKRATENYEPVRFLVDGNALGATATFIQALWETPPAEEEEPEAPTTGTDDPEDPTSGTEEPETVPKNDTVVEDIPIYHSLNLASDISMNYLVPKANLEGYEDMTLVCTIPVYNGNDLVGTREVKLTAEDRDGPYYYFILTGLTAVHMNDEVEATLRLTKDGVNYCSLADRYSIARYAYVQLSKESTKANLKTLCAELLRYGAAAQTYKGYRTDNLADSLMTEEQRALTTPTEEVVFDAINTVTGEGEPMGVAWVGKALLLDSKVTIRYIVDLNGFSGEISDLSLVLSYENVYGEEKTATITAPVLYNEEKGFYSFDFDGLLAAELRQPVYATIYCGEIPVTGMSKYSASTYGNNKTGALGELCKCLMSYSDSAKAFFAG